MAESLKLRRLSYHPSGGCIWLVTWDLEEPVWCVVLASTRAGLAMATVTEHVQELPWRSDTPTRYEVGKVALQVEGS